MIKNSLLNDLIDKPQKISKLKFDSISRILKAVKNILEEEDLLLDFNFNEQTEEVYVIGDIHGNLNTLMKLIEIVNKNKANSKNRSQRGNHVSS